MRARAGFTIIELTVVLLIITIAIAVTVPALLQDRTEDDVTAAGRQLETLFRVARDSAARSGAPIVVSIDSVSGKVWLSSATDSAQYAAADAGFTIPMPSQVRLQLTKARAQFHFAPSGAVFGDTLLLRTSLVTRRITLDPWTGDAIVH